MQVLPEGRVPFDLADALLPGHPQRLFESFAQQGFPCFPKSVVRNLRTLRQAGSLQVCFVQQSICRQRELEQGVLRIMTEQRYEDITVIDLCNGLNIPRKAFYRYFSSKEGALFALIDHTLMDFTVDFFASGQDATYGTLERFFRFLVPAAAFTGHFGAQ